MPGGFDDFFDNDDFLIDPEDEVNASPDGSEWNTGVNPDIFTSGNQQDIFSTKSLAE